jgi:hypothetical protein
MLGAGLRRDCRLPGHVAGIVDCTRQAVVAEVPQEAAHYLPLLRGYNPALASRARMRPTR